MVPYNERQRTKFVRSVNMNRTLGATQQFGEQVCSIRVPLLRRVKKVMLCRNLE
jgi:hypothetical protein